MDDSTYIFFFSVQAPATADSIFDELKRRVPGLVLKHRPAPHEPFQYSVQYAKNGTRFWDEDLDGLYRVVREAGGSITGSRIFYADEDFS